MSVLEASPIQAAALRILVVEDEDEMAAHLSQGLTDAGWDIELAQDGEAGFRCACEQPFDVLVVDRMLPLLDGLALVGRLRIRQVQTPVLFLTAMGSVADRVAGLEGGGDDYLLKPFAFAELNARVSALARRRTPSRERTLLQSGDLVLDRLARGVRRGVLDIELLPLEFKLLEFLMLNAGRVVTRTMLLEQVWGFHFDPRTNIVETHISRLRSKIDLPGGASLITTVRGAGYVVAG